MQNFIQNLTDIRAHFIIKKEIEKNKILAL